MSGAGPTTEEDQRENSRSSGDHNADRTLIGYMQTALLTLVVALLIRHDKPPILSRGDTPVSFWLGLALMCIAAILFGMGPTNAAGASRMLSAMSYLLAIISLLLVGQLTLSR
jgi:hypothetical protein